MPDPVPNDGVSPNRGVMIVLAYLWLLALVPLLFEKTDAEVQWHAKHGIVLTVAELVALLGYLLVTSLISLATLPLGCVLSLFLVFAWVGVLALHVVAIIKGINGDRLIIPGISAYAGRL
ncbi:MAG TPA: hypothetical protein VGQ77_08840 [Methylomirabilota bacterium]|jgi:uncharacterized membrane protein|nr:hypothetical protein [Methylomirabilota bacterium]